MADETKEAVTTTESAPVEATQEVVNTPAEATTQETTTQTETDTTQTDQAVNLDVDEYGVPWKNRAMEWKRKSEETIERLPTLIDEAVKGSFQQHGKPQEQEYTIKDFQRLEDFAQEHPEHRAWVEETKAGVIERQAIKKVEEKFKVQDSQKEAQRLKGQAFNYVATNFPDVFVKNAQGQLIGMNEKNPMVAHIESLMKDPRFANDPEGFAGAAEIAWSRVNRGLAQQKESKLKAEVKHLQKQTLVEGGNKQNVQAVPAHRVAYEKAKQTGNLKDIAAALKAMAEAKKAAKEQ